MRKNIAPFPSLQRLARHVKEVHILKSQGRVVHPDHRSKYVLFLAQYSYFSRQIAKLLLFSLQFVFIFERLLQKARIFLTSTGFTVNIYPEKFFTERIYQESNKSMIPIRVW